MQNFVFQNPTKIIFGKGSISQIAVEIPKEARVLITYGEGSVNKCLKVFAEGQAQKRRVTSLDAYQSGAQAAESIPALKLAICIYEYTPDDTTQFFKNVAYNRGVQIEFFNDKQKALAWLGIDQE